MLIFLLSLLKSNCHVSSRHFVSGGNFGGFLLVNEIDPSLSLDECDMEAPSRSWDMFSRECEIMAEDEEIVLLFSQGMEAFTSKELANVLAKKGFTPEQCRVLEGKFLNRSIFVRRSVCNNKMSAQISPRKLN